MNNPDLLLKAYQTVAHDASTTLAGYLRYLVIDSTPPARFAYKVEPWQLEVYGLLCPLFEAACGVGEATPQRAAFLTAGRGHSKTSTIAHLLNWALCYSKHHISVTAAAADRDQASILVARMQREASHNPQLALSFKNWQVTGPKGVLSIISSDAPTSSGKLDDIILCDEISWWRNRDLMDILLSGRNKRERAITVILSNAGIKDSWQWDLWETARASPLWLTHEIPAFSASWLDRVTIEDDKKFMLPAIYARLHENRWIDELEDSTPYLPRPLLEACLDHERQTVGQKDISYVAALDYATVYDRTAACIMHAEGEDVYLDDMEVWQGAADDRMQIAILEEWLEQKIKDYRIVKVMIDPWQLEHTCQKIEKKYRRVEVERFSFGGSHHQQLAENLRSLVINRRCHLYPKAGLLVRKDGTEEDLVDEASNLKIEERPGGKWRFQHGTGQHDDRTIVLAMASLAAVRHRNRAFATTLLEALNKKEERETEMADYNEIKEIKAYGTYQAIPVIKGEPHKLGDYPTKLEAAFAVNIAHALLESKPPNDIATDKLPTAERQEAIRKELVGILTERRLLPLVKPAPTKKGAPVTPS